MKDKCLKKNSGIVLLIAGFIVNVFKDGLVGNLSLMICSIDLFEIIWKIQIKKDFHIFRMLSTDIYFMYLYVWSVVYTILYGEKLFGLNMLLLTTIISILLPYFHEKKLNNLRRHLKRYAVEKH